MIQCKVFKKKFQTLDALKREVAVSQEEIERLEARVIQLEQELDFQDRTRELVSFSHRYKESFHILSKILMKKIDDRDHLLYLDAGSRKGIHKNMIVVYKNSLVGRVTQVYPLYSEVACITDRRCKITAELYNKKIKGIYEGENKEQAVLKFVPHFQKVEQEDRLYSSGEGLLYPKGFFLGTVSEIKTGAVDQIISIQPPVDFNTLEYVYIIKGS